LLTFAIAFPTIDPVMIEIGPLVIRWYALAYIAGLVLGWLYLRWLVQRPGWRLTPTDLDDLLLYVTLGVVLGGRLGYVMCCSTVQNITLLIRLKSWRHGPGACRSTVD